MNNIENEAQSARAESTLKGVNCVTQVQQQRPELLTVTLTWHARKYKVHIITPISVCRLRERGRRSKSVYVRVFHDLELLSLRCTIERQL